MSRSYTLKEFKTRYPGEAAIELLRGRLYAYRRLAALGADICFVKAGPYRVYLLAHPDLFAEVVTEKEEAFTKGNVLRQAGFLFGGGLLTSDGERHRRHRRLITHSFHHSRIRAYADVMVETTRRRINSWDENREVVVDYEMMGLTLEIVSRTLFGVAPSDREGELGDTFRETLNILSRRANPLAFAMARLSGVDAYQRHRSARRLDRFVTGLLERRRSDPTAHADLLQMMIEAEDADGRAALSDAEIRDEVITFLASGHETTSVALTWVWYLLARHPEAQSRLHDEIDTVLGGRLARFDDLDRLSYTRRVFSETLRMYAPLWAFARQASMPVEVGGHWLRKGDYVLLSPLLIHHDERFWPHPERFDPDRFLPEHRSTRPKFAYVPFSAGPRGCIGEQFAWTESLLAIATIAQQWSLISENDDELAPAAGLLTLRPARPLRMLPVRRHAIA